MSWVRCAKCACVCRIGLGQTFDHLPLPDGSVLNTGNLRFSPQQVDSAQGYVLLWDGAQRQMLDTYNDMLGALGICFYLLDFGGPITSRLVCPWSRWRPFLWGLGYFPRPLVNAGAIFGNIHGRRIALAAWLFAIPC